MRSHRLTMRVQRAVPHPSAVITFAPSDANRVYAVGSSGLFRSTNGGASFIRTPAIQFGSVAADPGNADVVYVGSWAANRGVFKSSDGGSTLQLTGLTSGNFSALAVDPQDTRIVYAGNRSGSVFRSLDGGATFAPAGTGLAGTGVMGLGIDPSNLARLYVWMHDGGLFRTDDRAASWKAVDTGEALRRCPPPSSWRRDRRSETGRRRASRRTAGLGWTDRCRGPSPRCPLGACCAFEMFGRGAVAMHAGRQ